jgi:signal transduction histidine kinase
MEQTAHPQRHHVDPFVPDTLLALGLTVFTWINLSLPQFLVRRGVRFPGPDRGPFVIRPMTPSPLAYVLVAACFLPLAFRRRYPLTVLAISTAGAAVFELFRHPSALTVIAPLVAIYTVGTLRDRRTLTVAAVLTALVLLSTSLPPFTDVRWLAEVVRIVAMVAVAAAVGDAVRTQRAYVREAERRAEEAEARAEEETRRRVDEERLRIARELHDVTAHSLSVIAVQSGAASHVIDSDTEAARRALSDIKRTSREALAELRSVVGSLRAAGDTAEEAPLAPSPGLSRLPELLRPVEDAGYAVSVDVSGDLTGLPQLVDASAYRIVQEALTNIIRHARSATAVHVAVANEGDLLSLQVADDGRETASAEGGHGIAGMRERAIALGGTFSAGLRPEGGWRVAVTLPLNGRRSA